MATVLVTLLFVALLTAGGIVLHRELSRPLDLAWRDTHFVAAVYGIEVARRASPARTFRAAAVVNPRPLLAAA